jgi:O-antigen ligase
VLFVALTFTGSRAGLLGGACGALATALALAARRRRLELGSLGLVAPLVGLIAVVAIGTQAGFGRWLATSAYELSWSSRLEVYRATVELWQRFPLTGTGLASFREAFPLVQPAGLAGTWWHAHNDLLELLATTGLVGALLVAAGAAGLLVAMLDRLREAGSSEEAAAVAAALGALAAVAVHSWFDFGLTMPANAAALVIVCGAALGRSGRA